MTDEPRIATWTKYHSGFQLLESFRQGPEMLVDLDTDGQITATLEAVDALKERLATIDLTTFDKIFLLSIGALDKT